VPVSHNIRAACSGFEALHAEASKDPSGLEATQNISYPWPYLCKNKRKGQTKR